MLNTILIALLIATVFAWVSRMCGGGKPKLPWGLDQWIYALPHGALGYAVNPWLIPLSYFVAFFGKRTGHGQWFDLGTSAPHNEGTGKKPEKLDFIVRFFMGKDNGSFKRDMVGMTVSGLAIALGSVLTLAFTGHFLMAALVALGGAMKGLMYAVGQYLEGVFGLKYNEWGEILTGFVDSFAVSLCTLLLLGAF